MAIGPQRPPAAGSGTSTNNDPRFTTYLASLPTRQVFVKNEDGSIENTHMVLLEDGTLLAPEGFSTESGSVDFGDLIRLSESSGFLAIQNNLNNNRYRLVDHYVPKDAPSSAPGYVQMLEAENEFVAQPSTSIQSNTTPLIFNYTTQLFSRVNSLHFKTYDNMTNVRMKITDVASGVAMKYYPSKASWESGLDGATWSSGDINVDFGDSPLLFQPNTQVSYEIRSSAPGNKLLGANGIPYLSAYVQRGEFRYLADAKSVPTKTSQLTNDSGFVGTDTIPVKSVNGKTGDVVLAIPAGQVNSDWNSSSGVSQILNKPTIPTTTSQLTNDSNYLTASTAPVKSVNGQTGNVSILIPNAQIQSDWNQSDINQLDFIKNKPTIPTVNYPVNSVNGKTGVVVLSNTDVGAAATQHMHAISEVGGLEAALNNKVTVGQSIDYNVLVNAPIIPGPQVNSDWSATSGVSQILNKPTTLSGYGITDAVTQTGLNNILSGYVTSASFNTALSNYATTISLNNTLANYATTSSLASYATNSALSTGLAAKFNTPTGTVSQYVRGDGSLANFPSTVFPVNSVNGKTGTVVLSYSDVGAAATSHTHVIADVTGLQSALDSKYSSPAGTSSQYVKGDGSLGTTPIVPTMVSAFTNDAGYLTGINTTQIVNALGYSPYNGTSNPNGYVNQLGARSSVSLTTTGASGSASYNSSTGVLNIPVIPAAQVNTDWNSVSGVSQLLNKPTTLSGYGITDAVNTTTYNSGLASKYNVPAGSTAQYVRGDGSLASFPTIPTVPTIVSAFTNDSGYITSANLPIVRRVDNSLVARKKVKYYTVVSDSSTAVWTVNLGTDFTEVLDVQVQPVSVANTIAGVRQSSLNAYTSTSTSISGMTYGNNVLTTILVGVGANTLAIIPSTTVRVRVEGVGT